MLTTSTKYHVRTPMLRGFVAPMYTLILDSPDDLEPWLAPSQTAPHHKPLRIKFGVVRVVRVLQTPFRNRCKQVLG